MLTIEELASALRVSTRRVADLQTQVKQLQDTLALQKRSYEREIELEVAAERERCAKLCAEVGKFYPNEDSAFWRGCMTVKAAIERKEEQSPRGA